MGRRVAVVVVERIWGYFSRIGSLFAHRRESTIVLSEFIGAQGGHVCLDLPEDSADSVVEREGWVG